MPGSRWADVAESGDDDVNGTDVKDVMVAGCRVHLVFHAGGDGRWSVEGTVRCGIEDRADAQSFRTGEWESREAAEQDALHYAADLLGHNVDRNTSRVRNYS